MADLDKTITEMMEYVCDSLCRYPEMESEEETLAEICQGCRLKEFVSSILGQGSDRTNEKQIETDSKKREPKKIILTYYQCPHCGRYKNESSKNVMEHMQICSYNPELPPKDCLSCRHRRIYRTHEKCGHARGFRPVCEVSHSECKRGIRLENHAGYNGCYAYETKSEQ